MLLDVSHLATIVSFQLICLCLQFHLAPGFKFTTTLLKVIKAKIPYYVYKTKQHSVGLPANIYFDVRLKNILSPNCFLFLFRENQQLLSVNVSKPSAMKTNEKKKIIYFYASKQFFGGPKHFQ